MVLWYLYRYIFGTPLGWLFIVVLVFLLGCCVMGVVDFKSKKKPLAPESDGEELSREREEIIRFLEVEMQGSFEVSYFDGAFQIFTTPDTEITDEAIYKKLRTRFPQRGFGLHRTLHRQSS